MTKADQFGLWPQSAATLDALLCMQIESCLPFSNSNPQFKPTDMITSAIGRNRMKNWEVIADNLRKALLQSIIVRAKECGCQRVALDSAFHREEAHRFYEQHGFENRAYLFSKVLS